MLPERIVERREGGRPFHREGPMADLKTPLYHIHYRQYSQKSWKWSFRPLMAKFKPSQLTGKVQAFAL